MRRFNPGIFEPLVYLVQRPQSFRVIGLGGLAVFTVLMLSQAFIHGAVYGLIGLLLLGGLWLESSLTACRRCRYYATWHCLGQGMVVSKIFSRVQTGAGEPQYQVHLAMLGAYLLYGLFWLWHVPTLGFIFTLWLPLLLLSADAPNGFSYLLYGLFWLWHVPTLGFILPCGCPCSCSARTRPTASPGARGEFRRTMLGGYLRGTRANWTNSVRYSFAQSPLT